MYSTCTTTVTWILAIYADHRAAGTKCLPSCDTGLAEISSAFRRNCMKWKAAKRQVLKISVAWLRGREESSEHSWSAWVYEACGCSTVCVGCCFCGSICTLVLCLGISLNIILCGRSPQVWGCMYLFILVCAYITCTQWVYCTYMWDEEADMWLRVNSLWCDNLLIQYQWGWGRWKAHPAGLNYITASPDMLGLTLLA